MTSKRRDPAPTPTPRELRRRFIGWARRALPEGQRPASHHRLLIEALCDVCLGDCDRLMVLMPPGSAKSTYGSVLFPPLWFGHHPNSQIICCSHTASLAEQFGSKVRSYIQEHHKSLGYSLRGHRARHDFTLTNGASYYAIGVNGAVTGRRADLVVIDDPVRSLSAAESAREREHLWDWYRSELVTRLKPGGRIVLIMTRWHEDDLGGRLLTHEHDWRCLRLPALAEADDPLARAEGAPLWPEWESAAELDRKRTTIGERQWAALFQQSPRPLSGTTLKVSNITHKDTASPVHCVRGWDLAATSASEGGDPDWTVGVKLGREATGCFVVLDVVRLRGSPHEVETAITRAAIADGPNTVIALPQDPGQAGKAQARYLTSGLAGYRVRTSTETGSKRQRALGVESQIEGGNFAVLDAPWTYSFLQELQDFPYGHKDDQVDALSRAFLELIGIATPGRYLNTTFMAR